MTPSQFESARRLELARRVDPHLAERLLESMVDDVERSEIMMPPIMTCGPLHETGGDATTTSTPSSDRGRRSHRRSRSRRRSPLHSPRFRPRRKCEQRCTATYVCTVFLLLAFLLGALDLYSHELAATALGDIIAPLGHLRTWGQRDRKWRRKRAQVLWHNKLARRRGHLHDVIDVREFDERLTQDVDDVRSASSTGVLAPLAELLQHAHSHRAGRRDRHVQGAAERRSGAPLRDRYEHTLTHPHAIKAMESLKQLHAQQNSALASDFDMFDSDSGSEITSTSRRAHWSEGKYRRPERTESQRVRGSEAGAIPAVRSGRRAACKRATARSNPCRGAPVDAPFTWYLVPQVHR